MTPNARDVSAFLALAMVARIATRSARGTPQITPLWFVRVGGKLCMTNAETSPTVRNIATDPNVVIIFEADRGSDNRCLRIWGKASFRKDRATLRRTVLREVLKYHLAPAALASAVSHPRRVAGLVRYYFERRDSGVIEVSCERAEFLPLPNP